LFKLQITTCICWPIECTPRNLFTKVMFAKIAYIYWSIEFILRACFCQVVQTWIKYIHLLTNWMNSKNFIFQS
jgi:hypothetical protein